MAEAKNDWLGAGSIALVALAPGVAFFWTTSRPAQQLPTVWLRLIVLRALLGVVIWAIAIFSNRRKLGLRMCFELGALLLIGSGAFGLGRIFSDARVAPMLADLDLGALSNAMFVSGACIAAITLNVALKLLRSGSASDDSASA